MKKKKNLAFQCTKLTNAYCKGGLWFLSPKDEWIKAQRAQYNEFVESGLKSWVSMDQTTHTTNQR